MKKTIFIVLGMVLITCCLGLSDFSCNGTINGVVTNSASSPIEGASITTNATSFSATTDSEGSYEITGLPEGIYTVSASKDGWTPAATVEVVIAKKIPLFGVEVSQNFILLGKGTVTGRVTKQSDGSPLADACVYMNYSNYQYYSSTFTDSSGYYTIDNISPGDYCINAVHILSTPDLASYYSEFNITENHTETINLECYPDNNMDGLPD